MAYDRRTYKGNVAYTVTLASGIVAGDTSITLSDGSTFPDGSAGPFCITLDVGNAGEEKVKIASRTGNTLTVASSGRGYDGTTAASHASGVKVVLTISAVDLDEANQAVVQTIGKVTTAGDMLVGSGANALARVAAPAKGGLWVSTGVGAAPVWLPVGTDGQVLTADSTQTDGVKWASLSALGSTWTSYTPTVGGTGWAAGNGTVMGAYRLIDAKTLALYLQFVCGSTSTAGTGQLSLSLPGGMAAMGTTGDTGTMLTGWGTDGLANYALWASAITGATALTLQSSAGTTSGSIVNVATGQHAWSATASKFYLSGLLQLT